MNTLVARDVRFSYKNTFCLEIDALDVREGEVHALIGPNGCGKSTVLQLLAVNLIPVHGMIQWNDRPLSCFTKTELARTLAFLPQQVTPQFSMTAMEVVLMGRYAHMKGLGLPGLEDLNVAEQSLKRMQSLAFRDRDFATLSGGERQRVLLASVLAQQPRAVLLDEPTSALDIHHQISLLRLLRDEAERGTAILFSTHDLTLASHFANRVTLLDHGKRIVTGSVHEVFRTEYLEKVYGKEIRLLTGAGAPQVIPNIETSLLEEENPIPPLVHSPALLTLTFSRFIGTVGVFGLLALIGLILSPAFGMETIHIPAAIHQMLTSTPGHRTISAQILALRLPRVFLGLMAGMALGSAGAAFQCLLRNPLAEPYTLGIASTSSLGAVIALSFPALSPVWGPFSGVQIWALTFALANVAFLWRIRMSSLAGRNKMGLLLAGIALGLISGAAIMLVRFIANPLTLRAMDQWMVGGLEGSSWTDVIACLPFLVLGLILILRHCRDLHQIAFGEEVAQGRGVHVSRVQKRVLLGGSLATAAVVSVAGPIGFVGLLIPHIVRHLVGTDQRLVIPCSMFAGGAILAVADASARCLSIGGHGAEVPVGILTSLVGGLGFLILLLRRQHGNSL